MRFQPKRGIVFLGHKLSIISGYTYPPKNFASSLQKKCNEMEFLQCVCIRIFPRKDCSDQRKDLSFRRRFWGLGDFYGMSAEIFQIVKKSFVFGHSPAEQVPQQRTTHLCQ